MVRIENAPPTLADAGFVLLCRFAACSRSGAHWRDAAETFYEMMK
jgi:hypothetical protein